MIFFSPELTVEAEKTSGPKERKREREREQIKNELQLNGLKSEFKPIKKCHLDKSTIERNDRDKETT